jgi:hypothetical protein
MVGYTLASHDRSKNSNWNDVENDIRSNWENSNKDTNNKGPWEKFKDSIRYAWERARH